ncbi:MAG TPA: hypothetical protein VLL76_12345 [Candidatus Omnitrophota bacterium]|nr:hypothetical protein [Candidatus Omnitrophota bacterium]
MNDSFSEHGKDKSEAPIRLLVLGAVYAGAIFFAVAFSPAIGFVNPTPGGETGKIASAEAPSRSGQ